MIKTMGVLTGAALLCSSFAFADVSASDVLNDLHQANQMEIHMGKMAQEKGSTENVRNYGKTLTSDHTDNDKQVVALASKQNVTLKPAEPGFMDKHEMKSLGKLSGAEFDRTFSKTMIDDHKKNIDKLQTALKSPLPADVRSHVADTLPKLQKHLETAQTIYSQP